MLPSAIREAHGLGCAIDSLFSGSGGVLVSSMNIDRQNVLVTVWLLQHDGFPGEGGKSRAAFREAKREGSLPGREPPPRPQG